ncbi:MAG: Gfo/Idh/MocA family oxidoreductase [Candidatus Omnitrophica bacterium]|nr:Gfo/Idh/MocA family oxidoreductase [Candidatus Omnitrophota bacterium]MBU4140736.1 Gfo/Idh/MocA family oxidoreductase [Candidatus Omnitrophota bacterium]
MQKIKVGVVGVGSLGSIHARIFAGLPNVELAAIADIDPKKAKKAGRTCRCEYFCDYQQLFGKVCAASIVVPTRLHYQIARDFLEHNIHLLVEKPFTSTVDEADELLSLAGTKNLVLQVGHVERFNAAVQAVQKLPGRPKFIECHRLGPFAARVKDVGVVLDLMIHDIDIVLGLVNSPCVSIQAVGVNVLTGHEDIANARLNFKNGAVANITASRISPKSMRKIRLFCENAYISLDYEAQKALIYEKQGKKITRRKINIKKEKPLQKELQSFIRCVKEEKAPLVSGREGRDALAIATEILEKIKTHPPHA